MVKGAASFPWVVRSDVGKSEMSPLEFEHASRLFGALKQTEVAGAELYC